MYNVCTAYYKGGEHEVSERWKVMGLPLEHFNESGSVGEPFAAIQLDTGTIILTKEVYFSEADEERSSVHHPQMERERG
jgi:hypothetical protein